jgi:SAM-dependent methyltransferase
MRGHASAGEGGARIASARPWGRCCPTLSDATPGGEFFPQAAAGVYDRGRAPYPLELIAALDLPAGGVVLDLGAGTGLLSRALAIAGHDVVAVEPGAAMRAELERLRLRVLAGRAEELPLAEASVDGVACGDAWHWFDPDRAAAEVHRVLRPGGRLALVWRWAETSGERWAVAVSARLKGLRGDHPGFVGEQGREGIARHGGFDELGHRTLRYVHDTDHEGILAGIASLSFVARLLAPERGALLAELAAVVPPGRHVATTRAEVWTTTRRP